MLLNPSALALDDLFGQLDADTGDWSDGLLARALRKFSGDAHAHATAAGTPAAGGPSHRHVTFDDEPMAAPEAKPAKEGEKKHQRRRGGSGKKEQAAQKEASSASASGMPGGESLQSARSWHWIILDGRLSSDWVAPLESLMQWPTGSLLLPSGEMLVRGGRTRLIFETSSVENLTPAALGRTSFVFVDSRESCVWQDIASREMQRRFARDLPALIRDQLSQLLNAAFEAGLEFLCEHRAHLHLPPGSNIRLALLNQLFAVLSALVGYILQDSRRNLHAICSKLAPPEKSSLENREQTLAESTATAEQHTISIAASQRAAAQKVRAGRLSLSCHIRPLQCTAYSVHVLYCKICFARTNRRRKSPRRRTQRPGLTD